MAFRKMNLIEPLLKALASEKYVIPTPIQEQTIPILLEGKDVMGIAQTGTGKTAAFVLPILQKISEEKKISRPGHPRVLVLAPTRELASQIDKSFSTYGKYITFRQSVIFGGVNQIPQVKSFRRNIDVLIATPGRLLDLMEQGYVCLDSVEFFVLDEADRMLDMGFIRDIKRIVSNIPTKRQTLFFSATMSRPVEELARTFLRNPVNIKITPESLTVEKIEQKVFFVDEQNKNELLLDLLSQEHLKRVLIFVSMKHKADKVASMLNRNNIKTEAIHGNKSQNQRTEALRRFKFGSARVMVATDVAARGIDIDGISHVINYDLPNESETYVHRIGRTARAGAEGTAYSFCSSEDRDYLREIEKLIKKEIEHSEHAYHSETAKNATGKDARPPPRGRGRNRHNRKHDERAGGNSRQHGRGRGQSGGNRDSRRGNRNNKKKQNKSRNGNGFGFKGSQRNSRGRR